MLVLTLLRFLFRALSEGKNSWMSFLLTENILQACENGLYRSHSNFLLFFPFFLFYFNYIYIYIYTFLGDFGAIFGRTTLNAEEMYAEFLKEQGVRAWETGRSL
jgi:hypothetical protein